MSILDKAKRIRLNSETSTVTPPEEPSAEVQSYDINDQYDQSPGAGREARRVPMPPEGARLFFGRLDGRPTAPDAEGDDAVYHWTWEKGPGWFYTSEVELPAWTMCLRPGLHLHCTRTTHRGVRIVERVGKDG